MGGALMPRSNQARSRMRSWPAPEPMPPMTYERIRTMPARKRRGWVTWAALAVLFVAYVLVIRVVVPWLVSGRL